MATLAPATFAALLEQAVTEPGIVSGAYRQFHNYSLGNVLLAWSQCMERGITPGPLATYQRWRELGRQVRKGEKAITLCRPVTIKCSRPKRRHLEDYPSPRLEHYGETAAVLKHGFGQPRELRRRSGGHRHGCK